MIIYRDTKTGKFSKKSTWQRSKARGGTRYKRQNVQVRERESEIEKPEWEIEEIAGGFDSP